MHKTIIVTNKVKQIMYSTQTPPFIRVVLRPPPVAEKGSIALSEITSIRKCILCTTRYDYISDWTSAAISLQSYFNKYIVCFQDGSLCFVK
jgi:hypothetical protein